MPQSASSLKSSGPAPSLLTAVRQPLRVVDVTQVRAAPLTNTPDPGAVAFAARYAPSFYLDVGTACPMHCIYCSVERGPDDKDVRMEAREHLYQRMADAEAVGIRKLAFIGGEAASRTDLLHLCDVALAMGFAEITLTTKSVKLARPAFVTSLRDHRVTLVHFSLDSFDPAVLATHLASTSAPKQLLAGLHELLRQGVDVFLYIVLTRHSLPGLSAYVAEVARLQTQYGVTLPVVVTPLKLQSRADRNKDAILPSLTDVATQLRAASTLAGAQGVTLLHKSLPLCVVPELRHLALETYLEEGRLLVGSAEPLQAFRGNAVRQHAGCATCAAAEDCPGVDQVYTQVYGWDEFVPLSPT